MKLATEVITDLARASELTREWEALAVAASKPVAGASWVLGWWRHVAPEQTVARVIVVRDGERLVGMAPFYLASQRRGVAEYRLMASDFGACMEPLALPGRERELGEAIAIALSSTAPRADVIGFGPMPIASPWVDAVRESIPGRLGALVRRTRMEGAPIVELREPDFESWFQTLGSKLRRDLRRSERSFEEAGGTVRWTDASTLRDDAQSFARLHAGRWESRGWSRLADLGERLPDWVVEVVSPLIDEGRAGLCVLELDGEPICIDLHFSAGEEVVGVNVGWDQAHAKLGPAKLVLLRVIERAYANGAARVNLGNGTLSNKVRIANSDDPAAWTSVLAPRPRLPLAYAAIAPVLARRHTRALLARTLPERWFERLKDLVKRTRS